MLNFLGSLFYLVAALLCIRAAHDLRGRPEARGERYFWLGAGLFFCGLIAVRLLGLEDLLRDTLRSDLARGGAYANRRDFQSILAAIAILGFAGMIALAGRHVLRGPPRRQPFRAVHYAGLGIATMIGLIILRLVSFHTTDAILFGPLHMNWFVDIGSAALTGWAAHRQVRNMRASRARQTPRSHGNPNTPSGA